MSVLPDESCRVSPHTSLWGSGLYFFERSLEFEVSDFFLDEVPDFFTPFCRILFHFLFKFARYANCYCCRHQQVTVIHLVILFYKHFCLTACLPNALTRVGPYLLCPKLRQMTYVALSARKVQLRISWQISDSCQLFVRAVHSYA